MPRFRWALAFSAMIIAAVVAIPGSSLAQTELLTNGGLDSFDGSGLANGWARWWEEAPRPADGSLNYAFKPDWGPETNPALVQSGSGSQHIGTSWNPWHAGIQQTILAPPGVRVRITAYGRAFASTPDFPNPSDGAVQARVQLGADPAGGADWFSSAVQWSGVANPHDTWQAFTLEVTAGPNGKVTIFLAANYKGDSRYHLDVWWDSASAVVIEAATSPTAPTPTTGVAATAGAAATTVSAPLAAPPTSSDLPTPNADGFIIYTVQPGDTLWSIALDAGLTVDRLKALNELTSDSIIIGQRLLLGTAPPPTPVAAVEAATVAPTEVAAVGSGSICVTLFEDANGNGARDSGEGTIAGGQVRVTDGAGAGEQMHITDGATDPHCFPELQAGAYQVSAKLPAGYNPTTGNAFTVPVAPGVQAIITFGAQSSALPQSVGTTTPTADSNPNNSLTWIAIIGGVLALGLIGAGGFWMWRRR